MAEIVDCPVCGFPTSVEHEGQVKVCANCGTSMRAITQEIAIPAPLFTFGIGLVLGIIVGPALIASTTEGSKWLERQVKESMARK